MKKLLVTLSIGLTSLLSYSQENITTLAVQVGEWSKWKKEFIWENPEFLDFDVTIRHNVILVDDKNNSTYTTIGDALIDEKGTAFWRSVDDKSQECVLSLHREPGYFIMEIYYEKVAFRYIFEEKNENE